MREHARRLNLHVTSKPDSQEICFVPTAITRRLSSATRREATQPGTIINREGRVLGTHAGVHRFTIASGKGLGLGTTEPLYVGIKPAAAHSRGWLTRPSGRTQLTASKNRISGVAPSKNASHIGADPSSARRGASANPPKGGHQRRCPASAGLDGGTRVRHAPDGHHASQAVVFYDGDEALGGGWID